MIEKDLVPGASRGPKSSFALSSDHLFFLLFISTLDRVIILGARPSQLAREMERKKSLKATGSSQFQLDRKYHSVAHRLWGG